MAAWLAPLALLLVAGSLLAPFNHDEDQYYGAALAFLDGTPYRDFLYLQTPLTLWPGAALLALMPGHGLFALRIATALMGLALLWIVARTAEDLAQAYRAGAPAHLPPALAALLTVAGSYSFLFAATVYRNDMLPALLFAGACALAALRLPAADPARRRGTLAAIGLLLGLAASAKINYALLPAAPALWLLTRREEPLSRRFGALAFLGAGFAAGLAPTLLYLARAPEAFGWSVVHFGAHAPLDWYETIGEGHRLTPGGRALDSLVILAQGPALIAIGLVARARFFGARADAGKNDAATQARDDLLDLLLLVALIAAAVPNPAWRQYFLVPLPPLALRLPGALAALGATGRPRAVALGLLVLGSTVGLISWGVPLAQTAEAPERSILMHYREAHWLRETFARHHLQGEVATLSPHLVVDSGARLDPRFASGVFVYRWDRAEERATILRLNGLTADTAPAQLALRPPAAIVTGYEGRGGSSFGVDLDAPLRRFAERNRYLRLHSPIGPVILYIRPHGRTADRQNRAQYPARPSPAPAF